MATKKTKKRRPVAKPVKVKTVTVVKKAAPKKKTAAVKKDPLNSKIVVGDLKKLYGKLAKLKGETAKTLEDIAKKEAEISEVLDVNLAKFDEWVTVPTVWDDVAPICTTPMSTTPVQFPNQTAVSDGFLAKAVAYRQ